MSEQTWTIRPQEGSSFMAKATVVPTSDEDKLAAAETALTQAAQDVSYQYIAAWAIERLAGRFEEEVPAA